MKGGRAAAAPQVQGSLYANWFPLTNSYGNKINKGIVLIFVLAHDQAKDGRVCAQFKRNQRENKYCQMQ